MTWTVSGLSQYIKTTLSVFIIMTVDSVYDY